MSSFRLHHLLVFSSLLIAQPVLDLLQRHPQYFVASGAGTADLLALALVLTLLPGLVLIAACALCHRLTPRLQYGLHVAIVLPANAVLAAQFLNSLQVEAGFAMIVGLAAVGLTWAYAKTRLVPMVASALLPAVLIVPALFLYQVFTDPHLRGSLYHYGTNTQAPPANPVPVFYLVFDELPRYTLQGPDGMIDAARFPNLAAFAGQATWYRNASTVADSTENALPALLTGARPDHRSVPANYSAHPNNLFAALAGHYRMNVQEPVTRLCPAELCGDPANATAAQSVLNMLGDSAVIWAHRSLSPSLRRRLPPIDESWSGFGAQASGHKQFLAGEARFRFLDSLAQSTENSFNFAHIYLPHVPWKLLPSGRPYATHPREYRLQGADPDSARFRWSRDEAAIALGYQRHMLQTAYVDAYLGDVFRAIRDRSLWEQSLIVLVTDHGLSFRPGLPRRWVEAGNRADILSVPLLIKYPGQTEGSISDENAESVDIVATVADVLGLPLWWQTGGISLRDSPALARRDRKTFTYKLPGADGGFRTELLDPRILQDAELAGRRQRTFGIANADNGLFDISTSPSLLGRTIQDMGSAPGDRQAAIESLGALRRYRSERNRKLPVYIRGQLRDGAAAELAISLNGIIRATTQTFSGVPGSFACILDEQFLLPSDNDLRLFEVTGAGLKEISVVDAGH